MRRNNEIIKQHISGYLSREYGTPLVETFTKGVERVTAFAYACGISVTKVEIMYNDVVVETHYYA